MLITGFELLLSRIYMELTQKKGINECHRILSYLNEIAGCEVNIHMGVKDNNRDKSISGRFTNISVSKVSKDGKDLRKIRGVLVAPSTGINTNILKPHPSNRANREKLRKALENIDDWVIAIEGETIRLTPKTKQEKNARGKRRPANGSLHTRRQGSSKYARSTNGKKGDGTGSGGPRGDE